MIRRPPRSTQGVSSAASDVYKRQLLCWLWKQPPNNLSIEQDSGPCGGRSSMKLVTFLSTPHGEDISALASFTEVGSRRTDRLDPMRAARRARPGARGPACLSALAALAGFVCSGARQGRRVDQRRVAKSVRSGPCVQAEGLRSCLSIYSAQCMCTVMHTDE